MSKKVMHSATVRMESSGQDLCFTVDSAYNLSLDGTAARDQRMVDALFMHCMKSLCDLAERRGVTVSIQIRQPEHSCRKISACIRGSGVQELFIQLQNGELEIDQKPSRFDDTQITDAVMELVQAFATFLANATGLVLLISYIRKGHP
ncbi:MAG: hypothetical protein AAB408_05415 [Patescibacteria group bacterium]